MLAKVVAGIFRPAEGLFVLYLANMSLLFSQPSVDLSYSGYSELGSPQIRNYTPEEYDGHGQNWAVIEDTTGFLYFANTDGLILQYDGIHWRDIPISNGSIVRCFARDSDGKIFVGAQNEIGYLAPDSIGDLKYVSIMDEIDSTYHKFGNIWQIHATNDYLYFNTRKYLFRRDGTGVYKIWSSGTTFHSSFLLPDDRLVIHQMQRGLLELVGDSLKLLPGGDLFKDDWVYSVVPFSDSSWLIAGRKSGLFFYDGTRIKPFQTPANEWLITNHVYHGIVLNDGSFLFSTLRGGLIVLDRNGKVIKIIDKRSGLADNNIWFTYQDSRGSLWLTTNKGLTNIQFPGPFSFYDENAGLEGNVQDILRFDGTIYAATGLGVYKLNKPDYPISHPKFEFVPGLKSQCWDLIEISNQLFVSCNHGIFRIGGNQFDRISPKSAWKMIRSASDTNRIFLGLDDGIASLYKTGNRWVDEGKLSGFESEARTLIEDSSGNLWIGTVYEGVYYLELSNDKSKIIKITKFSKNEGLPSSIYNLVFPLDNGMIFGTTKGLYEYDAAKNRFFPSRIIGEASDYYADSSAYKIIGTDGSNNIWMNCAERPLFAQNQDSLFNLHHRKFFNLPKSSIYTFYAEPDGIVWIGGTKGIVRYDKNVPQDHTHKNMVFIRDVKIGQIQSIFRGTTLSQNKVPELDYKNNAVRFEYAANCLINPTMNQYKILLDGFDEDWSGWTNESKKDYTNLPEGKYTFKVQARDVYWNESNIATYAFRISPPWYRTVWAYVLYLTLFTGTLYFFIDWLIAHTRAKAIAEEKRLESIRKTTEEKLRSRVAADFHDELGNRITKISLFSEILKNNSKFKQDTATAYLDKITDNANKLYNETRDFIWHLDPQKDTLFDLMMRLKSFGDDLFEGTGTDFVLSGLDMEFKTMKLSMDRRQHILRIFKEALHNALKYGQSKNVQLSIKRAGRQVFIIVTDNGKGFEILKVKENNGLQNMKKRAEVIQGNLEIFSKPGSGTEIKLIFNLPE